jgi:protein-tyrosine phosphatase
MARPPKLRVLFVCMGNICRSPTAQGLFRSLLEREAFGERVEVDSAGTHGYHIGAPPDARAQRTALQRGIDLSDLRARQAAVEDFLRFDYVLAMDRENLRYLSALCPRGQERKLHLLMEFAPELGIGEVPDPYYGGSSGFDRVLDLLEVAMQGLLADIRQRL